MHPTDEQLIEFLDASRTTRVRRHLEGGCADCAKRLEGFRALVTSMRGDRDADPPAEWIHRAIALRAREPLAAVRGKLVAWASGLREEIARVLSDSRALPGDFALAGVRSVGNARRLRFESGAVELDLQIEPELGTAVVTGQFVTAASEPEPIGAASFLVVAGEGDPIEGITDRLGEFSIDTPEGADLQLRLRYDDRIVRFDVPPEPPPDS
ncbi:hypothetical protein K8I85_12935 [bacterium]|nr:hypothetical protein [bacterium]